MATSTAPARQELTIKTPGEGKAIGPVELVRGINEVFDSGEPGELSFVRGMLRCLGHSAIGDTAEIESVMDNNPDAEVPKVNPWKLVSSLAKSAVSGTRRREMLARIGEDMSIGDGLGLLAVIALHDYGKRAGLSKEQARDQAWNWYAGTGLKKQV